MFNHPLKTLAVIAASFGFGLASPASAEEPTVLREGVSLSEKSCGDGFSERVMDAGLTCYDFTAPEDRGRPNGRAVTMLVGVLPARPGAPDDPVVVLRGGPGTSWVRGVEAHVDFWRYAVGGRSLILLDPRGYLDSSVKLQCDEWLPNRALASPGPKEARLDLMLQALDECYDDLSATGARLQFYGDKDYAEDLYDLRQALGVKEWNIYGHSAGGSSAIAVLGYKDDGVRAIVANAAWTNSVKYTDFPKGAFSYFKEFLSYFFELCAEDKDCDGRYPDLETRLQKARAVLDERPFVLPIDEANPSEMASIEGDDLIAIINGFFFDSRDALEVPWLIDRIAADDREAMGDVFRSLIDGAFKTRPSDVRYANGVTVNQVCADAGPAAPSKEVARRMLLTEPEMIHWEFGMSVCPWWPVRAEGSMGADPVRSAVPTLLMAGGIDGSVPQIFMKNAAKTMNKSQYIEFPNMAHNVWGACVFTTIAAFLDAPEEAVDKGCVRRRDLDWR
ncbi:MAG: alpha/beta fold hydrolase [Pseudomonadota bacterium]